MVAQRFDMYLRQAAEVEPGSGRSLRRPAMRRMCVDSRRRATKLNGEGATVKPLKSCNLRPEAFVGDLV